MTLGGDREADREAQSVRRIFLVALAAALVAAGVTFGFELAHDRRASATAVSGSLPATFRQAGFVDSVVRRHETVEVASGARQDVLRVAAGDGPLYVVARCDTGRVEVDTGNLTSDQACTGQPVGVVALAQVRRPTRLDVTVSRPQKATWAIGIYR